MLVAAQMINDPGYRAHVVANGVFGAETLAMHRRVTRSTGHLGRRQIPWPRLLGTPPWAVARQMSGPSGMAGTRYSSRLVPPWRRTTALAALLAQITAAAASGHVVPLFIGSRWLPRHVVLVLDDQMTTYDPASGWCGRILDDEFIGARLSNSRWSRPWVAVLPR